VKELWLRRAASKAACIWLAGVAAFDPLSLSLNHLTAGSLKSRPPSLSSTLCLPSSGSLSLTLSCQSSCERGSSPPNIITSSPCVQKCATTLPQPWIDSTFGQPTPGLQSRTFVSQSFLFYNRIIKTALDSGFLPSLKGHFNLQHQVVPSFLSLLLAKLRFSSRRLPAANYQLKIQWTLLGAFSALAMGLGQPDLQSS